MSTLLTSATYFWGTAELIQLRNWNIMTHVQKYILNQNKRHSFQMSAQQLADVSMTKTCSQIVTKLNKIKPRSPLLKASKNTRDLYNLAPYQPMKMCIYTQIMHKSYYQKHQTYTLSTVKSTVFDGVHGSKICITKLKIKSQNSRNKQST